MLYCAPDFPPFYCIVQSQSISGSRRTKSSVCILMNYVEVCSCDIVQKHVP